MNKPANFFGPALLSILSAAAVADDGEEIPRQSGIQGGVVVHLGCGDGTVTAQLAAGPQYVVQGLDTAMANVQAARDARAQQHGSAGADLPGHGPAGGQ